MRIFNSPEHVTGLVRDYRKVADFQSLLHVSLRYGDIVDITVGYFLQRSGKEALLNLNFTLCDYIFGCVNRKNMIEDQETTKRQDGQTCNVLETKFCEC